MTNSIEDDAEEFSTYIEDGSVLLALAVQEHLTCGLYQALEIASFCHSFLFLVAFAVLHFSSYIHVYLVLGSRDVVSLEKCIIASAT